MGGDAGCLSASHVLCLFFLPQPYQGIRNCSKDVGLCGYVVKTSSGCKFYSYVFDVSFSFPPFFLSISMANLLGMAVVSGSEHCLFYLSLLCCFWSSLSLLNGWYTGVDTDVTAC